MRSVVVKFLTKCSVSQQIDCRRGILLRQFSSATSSVKESTTEPTKNDVSSEAVREDGQSATIGKAMQAYLTRAKDHQDFMDTQEKEFVFGRRHLANMMGKDPESFTASDIDEAIRYLFPSSLYERRARPLMKPPQEVYPKQKAAQFDASGRPHHPFFYTAKPNFFYLLHEMVGKLKSLNLSEGFLSTEKDIDSDIAGSVWISKSDLENRLLEKITDTHYAEWLSCMERLLSHKNVNKELTFIKSYRKTLSEQKVLKELPPVTIDHDGRKSVYIPVCMRKAARGEVTVRQPGTGQFSINGKGLEYFTTMQAREQILFPLQMSGMLGTVDVEASVRNRRGGETSESGCVRWGISTALAALSADPADVEKLRLAGLLTRDHRRKERSKIAHEGARKAWTWKKR